MWLPFSPPPSCLLMVKKFFVGLHSVVVFLPPVYWSVMTNEIISYVCHGWFDQPWWFSNSKNNVPALYVYIGEGFPHLVSYLIHHLAYLCVCVWEHLTSTLLDFSCTIQCYQLWSPHLHEILKTFSSYSWKFVPSNWTLHISPPLALDNHFSTPCFHEVAFFLDSTYKWYYACWKYCLFCVCGLFYLA